MLKSASAERISGTPHAVFKCTNLKFTATNETVNIDLSIAEGFARSLSGYDTGIWRSNAPPFSTWSVLLRGRAAFGRRLPALAGWRRNHRIRDNDVDNTEPENADLRPRGSETKNTCPSWEKPHHGL